MGAVSLDRAHIMHDAVSRQTEKQIGVYTEATQCFVDIYNGRKIILCGLIWE